MGSEKRVGMMVVQAGMARRRSSSQPRLIRRHLTISNRRRNRRQLQRERLLRKHSQRGQRDSHLYWLPRSHSHRLRNPQRIRKSRQNQSPPSKPHSRKHQGLNPLTISNLSATLMSFQTSIPKSNALSRCYFSSSNSQGCK
ncbi:hypothetical protein FGO68_gene10908 [Halteria grandinella]|uniref:Uncharacterized protein n=1 Tax=Halteria grandinella TaxID=5974 RepID=A0A8J8T7G1_HALGN|nr:hypothetical protein FGO68_gene10908 [Halteria grandinella]